MTGSAGQPLASVALSKASAACDFSPSTGRGARAALSARTPGARPGARHLSLCWQRAGTREVAPGEVTVTRTHAASPSDTYLRHHLEHLLRAGKSHGLWEPQALCRHPLPRGGGRCQFSALESHRAEKLCEAPPAGSDLVACAPSSPQNRPLRLAE